jgi:hypothetical protein
MFEMVSVFLSNSKKTYASLNQIAENYGTDHQFRSAQGISEPKPDNDETSIKYKCPFCDIAYLKLHNHKCKKLLRSTAREEYHRK